MSSMISSDVATAMGSVIIFYIFIYLYIYIFI
jgi:hypothetical protein